MELLRFWSTNKHRIGKAFGILLLPLFIAGCNPDSGLMEYEIEYPSGNVINGNTDFSEFISIEGSQLQICTKHIKDADYILYIQDAEGKLLYTKDVKENINRGQMVNGALWVCAERWTSIHTKQFLDTRLKTGVMYRLDLNSGEITFEGKLNENEFFLTMNGDRCYFYYRGQEREKKLFGLATVPSENAEIYYRDISNWEQKNLVYTFNYTGVPTEPAESGTGYYTLGFLIQTDEIAVTLYSYEFMNEKWENVPMWSVDVPYD